MIMKKWVLVFTIIYILLLVCSCKEKDTRPEVVDFSAGYKLIEIDGCEYIECPFRGYVNGNMVVHKANCKNPIHNYNKGGK